MLPCVVLCGGLATRLYPITESTPKSLISVAGEPFLSLQLTLLRSHGITDVVLCVGHLGDMIQSYAGDGSLFGVRIRYSCDGQHPLGTAGAIRKALPLLEPEFFVLYGDSYLECDYRAVAQAFRESQRPGLMTVFHNRGNYDRSNVEAVDGVIVQYDKTIRTSRMQHIDYGLGAFRREVFESLPADEFIGLDMVYQRLLNRGDLAAYEIGERFYEIGSQQGIRDLEAHLAQ